MPKETYVPTLFQLFRHYGYDGATLSKISEATGLGKASLYHYFPGGKDEMVAAVLTQVANWLEDNILRLLREDSPPQVRFTRMCDRLNALYESGTQPCLSAILLSGSVREEFQAVVQSQYRLWIDAIAAVLTEAGLERQQATERGEDALIAIQGSLIVSQGLKSSVPFQRTIRQIPTQLCQDLES